MNILKEKWPPAPPLKKACFLARNTGHHRSSRALSGLAERWAAEMPSAPSELELISSLRSWWLDQLYDGHRRKR